MNDTYRAFHQKEKIEHSSQVHTELSSGLTTFWAIRQGLVNLRKSKSYQASFFYLSQGYEIRNKVQKKTLRNTNNILLNNHWITEEIKKKQNNKSKKI